MDKISPSNVYAWAKANMKKDEVDISRSDVYVKVTPVSEFMVKNLWDNRYSKPHKFHDQITKSPWYEFPMAGMYEYTQAKKRK